MSVKIGVWGASTTWGMYDDEGGGWVDRLKLDLLKKYPKNGSTVQVFNLAVSGALTSDILDRFDAEAKHRDPNVVILSLGVNDSMYQKSTNDHAIPVNVYQEIITNLILKAQQYTRNIIVTGPYEIDESKTQPVPWATDCFYKNEYVARYRDVLKETSTSNGVQFIDFLEFITASDLHKDGLHLNSDGHCKIFEKVRDFLLNNNYIQ